MWTYHSDLLATPVPRYTSYPTAAEFRDDVGLEEQLEALAAVPDGSDVSLYVHIPFCREICWYCGCNTGRSNRSQRLEEYLRRLEQEFALVSARLGSRKRISRIAFGGGSPNAISPRQFLILVDGLRRCFSVADDAIWSIEIDPRGFDEAFSRAIASAGFTRASLGVQTFAPSTQAAIGRVQPRHSIESAIDWLRKAGIDSLNMDLMYGLPGQDRAELLDGIWQALALGADRLAVFGYAHVPHLIARQRKIDGTALPAANERFTMAAEVHELVVSRGWQPVGFDHFARPADPLAAAAREHRVRRNFQGFTDDPCDILIGLGASSISRLPGLLIQNEKNNGRYGLLVGNERLAGNKGVALTPAEQRRGRLIEELLCQGSTDLGSLPELAELRQDLHPFADRGLARWDGNALTITDDGSPYARVVAAKLDPWRAKSKVKFSSAV